jgi:pantetheine-phosphate adenylyltransferase
MKIGLYPGTFDPATNGHVDILGRAVKLVDKLIVGVASNASKNPLFSLDERVEMMRIEAARFKGYAEIEVRPMTGLLIQFAEDVGAQVIIRGLRAVSDFEYEFQMTGMNQRLNADIETVFFMADPRHQAIASRLIKEIARLGGDISPFVSPAIAKRLMEKISNHA